MNTASECGYTPQYEGLEKMYKQYRSRGLEIVGFPSNDFGGQEPGSEQQIANFCRLTYGVQFPMFEKTHAAREQAHPLYQALGNASGQFPQWNFHKYLIDRKGNLAASFPSAVQPYAPDLIQRIDQLL